MDIINSFNFQITTGVNYLYLPQSYTVNKSNFITITQITGKVAIDTTGTAAYSDMSLGSVIWNQLSADSNWRLYLKALTNFSCYTSTFSISHTYKSIGLYNITLTLSSSNDTFQQTVNITDCK